MENALRLGGEEELKEEEESWCGEEARGDEDDGIWRLPQSPSTPEESNRSPSEEIKPSDSSQDLRGKQEAEMGTFKEPKQSFWAS